MAPRPRRMSLNVGSSSFATGIPLPTHLHPKLKLESTRTTKTNQKLVVFPEEIDPSAFPEFLYDKDRKEAGSLRRVTAYLTAESYRLRDLADYLGSKSRKSFVDPKRYDEVLYTPYSFGLDIQTLKAKNFLPGSPLIDDKTHTLQDVVASDSPVGEVFYFDYGVIVIWGLEEIQERDLLGELSNFEGGKLESDDIEIETFKFCHDPERPPRLFNDVIHLRSGHHMVKLTISHALAQSVKLAYFEELVENTILRTKDIPRSLAITGSIGMSRKSITRQVGELFVMRINVNLVSNVLDTPELFWAEPTLCPLYRAVRGYLEISQRIDVLNQRCTVISDMLDMLREHANQIHGEYLEWTVIILISLEILIGLITICIDFYTKWV